MTYNHTSRGDGDGDGDSDAGDGDGDGDAGDEEDCKDDHDCGGGKAADIQEGSDPGGNA